MKTVTPAMMEKTAVTRALEVILADSHILGLKTQNFHWNVSGPFFASLHAQFQTQYEELADATDEIAERIRALGVKAPGSYREFSALATIPEADRECTATEMVTSLLEGHRAAARSAKKALDTAQAEGDDVTVDLMVQRITVHDKTAWMLAQFLEG